MTTMSIYLSFTCQHHINHPVESFLSNRPRRRARSRPRQFIGQSYHELLLFEDEHEYEEEYERDHYVNLSVRDLPAPY